MVSYQIFDNTHSIRNFDGYSLGIYYIDPKSSHFHFARNAMVITQNLGSYMVSGSILRDLDFSFALENKESFQVGLFLFNPKRITYEEVKSCYQKDLPIPDEFFYVLGVYTLEFHSSSLVLESECRFILKAMNRNHVNFVKFSFYFMKMERTDRPEVFSNVSTKTDVLYYISNPIVEFNLDDLNM
jgi:hypothetical protein